MAEGLLKLGAAQGRVLLPRAREAGEVLPDTLRRAGAEVDVVPVYETVPAQGNKDEVLRLLAEGRLDCVTFGSSSTVRNFLAAVPADTLKAHPEIKLACIGPVTADTLASYGLAADIRPADYTVPALVRAVADAFTTSATSDKARGAA